MDTGLRERHKLARREHIVATAIHLFVEHGFDAVRVVDIAAAADVSPGTVYNYFPTKEDLVFAGGTEFEQSLVDALTSRAEDVPLVEAFRAFTLEARGALGQADQAPIRTIARVAQVILDSPTLQLRAGQDFERCTGRIAELVMDERGEAVTADQAWVIANAMVGVTRTMQQIVRRLAIADRPATEIARVVLDEGRRALDQLEAGIGTVAPGPTSRHQPVAEASQGRRQPM